MSQFIAVTEAKARLSTLLRDAEGDDVTLMRHGHPAGVLISPARYEALISAWEDAIDIAAIEDARVNPQPTIGIDELIAGIAH